MSLNELKNLVIDRIDLDEAANLYAIGRGLLDTNEKFSIPNPAWLTDNMAALEKEIKLRRRDALEKASKSVRARLEALKTADEKRADLRAELEKLEAALNS